MLLDDQPYKVLDKDGNFLYYLEEPTDTTVAGVDQTLVDNYKSFVKEATLECKALNMDLNTFYMTGMHKIFFTKPK